MKYEPKPKLKRWQIRHCEADHTNTQAEGSWCWRQVVVCSGWIFLSFLSEMRNLTKTTSTKLRSSKGETSYGLFLWRGKLTKQECKQLSPTHVGGGNWTQCSCFPGLLSTSPKWGDHLCLNHWKEDCFFKWWHQIASPNIAKNINGEKIWWVMEVRKTTYVIARCQVSENSCWSSWRIRSRQNHFTM